MIKFKTINVDGLEIERVFDTFEEFSRDWYSEDNCTLPSLDDEMLFAEVEGKQISGTEFNDLIQYLWSEYGL